MPRVNTQFKKGQIPWNKGKPGLKGENNPAWKGGVTKVNKNCMECSKQFIARDEKFCSHKCYWKFMDNGKTDLHERLRKSKDYALWRTAVFMRDDYTCQSCGHKGDALHADHIKPFAFYPELRLAIDNGRTLCVVCHKQTDTYGRHYA